MDEVLLQSDQFGNLELTVCPVDRETTFEYVSIKPSNSSINQRFRESSDDVTLLQTTSDSNILESNASVQFYVRSLKEILIQA